MRPRTAEPAKDRYARPFDFVVAGCAVLAFGAVLYASTSFGKRAAQFSEAEARLGKIHRAMVAYGEDFDVWDELPGWGRVSQRALSVSMVKGYLGAGGEDNLWSPAHRPGWRRHASSRNLLGTSHWWSRPSESNRGTLFPCLDNRTPCYRNTLEEAVAREERYAVVIDQVFDMEHYYPVENDQSKGAVLVELEVGGATHVTRRSVPRFRFEQWFGQETNP
ncbi:MAG: hypothetical protein KF884_10190 [Fimbriimonadaceae bacterium]|nr:hypothetical protein [Fimbriimonadaceae bacterium]QYK57916.1 MAG: hypothetical protein KF884_10190 [Fimbriimonadaceae bacterium]